MTISSCDVRSCVTYTTTRYVAQENLERLAPSEVRPVSHPVLMLGGLEGDYDLKRDDDDDDDGGDGDDGEADAADNDVAAAARDAADDDDDDGPSRRGETVFGMRFFERFDPRCGAYVPNEVVVHTFVL